jgi:hypothetical protein
MSLIPSESLNFPDHFRATIKPWSPKAKTSLPPSTPLSQIIPVEPPSIPPASPKEKTSLPPPKSVAQTVPVKPPGIPPASPKEKTSLPPKPSPQTVPVEPHRIPIVPRAKVRFSKQPVEGFDDFGAGRRDPPPRPIGAHGQKFTASAAAKSEEAAPPCPAPQAGPSESGLSAEGPSLNRRHHVTARRRNKLFQFLLCEAVAISILLPLVMLGISGRFTDQTLILLIRILIVSAVAAVVIFPMIFFRRWENSRARER